MDTTDGTATFAVSMMERYSKTTALPSPYREKQ